LDLITSTNTGKARRMLRLFSPDSGRTIIVPVDDSLISGPSQGLELLGKKLERIVEYPPNAIMGFPGLFRRYSELCSRVACILNLTASTVRSTHTRKVLIGSVKQAVQLGMDAVAIHVNITSNYESEMIHTLGTVSETCENYAMPLLAIMYARSEKKGSDENYIHLKKHDRKQYANLVAHAARIGLELGADVIKTQYTGDLDSFRFVIDACRPVPVVAAGGPTLKPTAMLQMAHDIIRAGAAGISFGRNIFGRVNPQEHLLALAAIVHDGATPAEAIGHAKKILSPNA
jgi:fructose-bisphosphate aldolase/2-amino-3,7-dideoxy-D-threo-hept-6-ulosonate synthase